MGARTAVSWLVVATAASAFLVGCGPSAEGPAPSTPAAATPDAGFRSGDCNGVTDADVAEAAGPAKFTKSVVSDAGCFWQENSMFGTVGAGMGISTWWYRGSDMDTER